MAVVTSPSILLSTRLGRIRGTIERMEEEDLPPYYAFRGIRYAKAPLGDLRWKVTALRKNIFASRNVIDQVLINASLSTMMIST